MNKMQDLQDKISPLFGEVTSKSEKRFTLVLDGMQIDNEIIENIKDRTNSELHTIIFDQGKLKVLFKFI